MIFDVDAILFDIDGTLVDSTGTVERIWRTWAAQRGLSGLSLAELAEHPEVVAEIEAGVDEVMASFNNAERVKKVRILGEEWLPDSELLTPTSKLKRRGIHATFAAEIEAIYS